MTSCYTLFLSLLPTKVPQNCIRSHTYLNKKVQDPFCHSPLKDPRLSLIRKLYDLKSIDNLSVLLYDSSTNLYNPIVPVRPLYTNLQYEMSTTEFRNSELLQWLLRSPLPVPSPEPVSELRKVLNLWPLPLVNLLPWFLSWCTFTPQNSSLPRRHGLRRLSC